MPVYKASQFGGTHAEVSRSIPTSRRDTALAMPQGNVEIVRIAYDAFNRRDLDALWPALGPEFEVDLTSSMGFDRSRYLGRKGVRSFFESYWDSFESISIDLEECIEGENAVVAVIRARGRGCGSGVEVDARGPHLWSFREGRAVRLALHEHLEDALEAAGLQE
jgi:ketosteroid isomerase-like protein